MNTRKLTGGKKANRSRKHKKTFKKELKAHKRNTDKHIEKSMKKLQCSPVALEKGKKKKNYSCLSDDALIKLKNIWNARHPDALIHATDSKAIWNKLREHMQNVCNKESCWLKQGFVEGKLDGELEDSFAPESPDEWKKKPNDWLSSTDILKVMKQYEKAYKCFEFIGPSPIDYDTKKLYGECVWEELCHFSLKDQIASGKTKIGVVFNLDPHYLGGSHWVSMFINIKKGLVYYFDSVGEKIPPRIKKFADDVIAQGKTVEPRINFKFDENYPTEHQYGNTECGIYSIFFIVHMLEDKITEHYLKTHILKDQYMHNFRKVYFNEDL